MAATDLALQEIWGTSRIRMVRRIAQGGMGSVYEGVLCGSEAFQKQVAVKTILQKYSDDADFLGLFIGEAKLVADLVHQNIVQIYHLGKFENTYYTAMEFVNGVNLRQFMSRHARLKKSVPVDLGVFIISRVCRGLEYAHNKRGRDGKPLGVVHRDISPMNLMLSVEGEVKITDFGIAKARNLMRDEEGEILMGKARYMSPEQAQYQATDRRSDLFSLGVVMFELMTGKQLFGKDETTVVLEKVVSQDIPDPQEVAPSLPDEVARILRKALQRDRELRYQTAAEMAYELEYYIYHEGYGPTIVTLEKYLRKLFPEKYKN